MRNLLHGATLAAALAAACASSEPPAAPQPAAPATPAEPAPDASVLERAARADSVRAHYTPADVDFMTGMIVHHAQALVMARMAPSHGASAELRTLAARIINGQRDEIALMQRWLRERDEPVPSVSEAGAVALPESADTVGAGGHGAHGARAAMGGHHDMAGMLSPRQLAELDAARGEAWDLLFLKYMIQHHQGALVMVDELFASHGAGQGDEIFRIASGIAADQATEIDRMQRMLQARVFGG